MKITAAVARMHGQPFTVEQLELDALRPNEVRVRMVACGICHTDAVARDGIYPTPLPPTSTATAASPLGCGLNTGAGTVLNELKVEAGATLAVLGTGAVGAGALMAAGIAGCTTIVAVDLHDSRLTLARELGATHTIHSKREDVVARLKEITGGKGIDYIVDTTAVPALLRQAAEALALRGTLATVGAAKPGTEATFEIGSSLIKGWTFKTVVQGSSVPQVFIPRLIALWKQGKFPFDKLLGRYALADINQGFSDSANDHAIPCHRDATNR